MTFSSQQQPQKGKMRQNELVDMRQNVIIKLFFSLEDDNHYVEVE